MAVELSERGEIVIHESEPKTPVVLPRDVESLLRAARGTNAPDHVVDKARVILQTNASITLGARASAMSGVILRKCYHQVPTTMIPTLAVAMLADYTAVLLWNPYFVLSLGAEGTMFALFHEARHLVHNHLLAGIVSPQLHADPLFELAIEAGINREAMKRLGMALPSTTVIDKDGEPVLDENGSPIVEPPGVVDPDNVYQAYCEDLTKQGLEPVSERAFYRTDMDCYRELKRMATPLDLQGACQRRDPSCPQHGSRQQKPQERPNSSSANSKDGDKAGKSDKAQQSSNSSKGEEDEQAEGGTERDSTNQKQQGTNEDGDADGKSGNETDEDGDQDGDADGKSGNETDEDGDQDGDADGKSGDEDQEQDGTAGDTSDGSACTCPVPENEETRDQIAKDAIARTIQDAISGNSAQRDEVLWLADKTEDLDPEISKMWGEMGLGRVRGETHADRKVDWWQQWVQDMIASRTIEGDRLVYSKKRGAVDLMLGRDPILSRRGMEDEHHVVVAIDTSGSMPDEVIQWLTQLVGYTEGIYFEWLAFDGAVEPFKAGEAVVGGGGTDFALVADYVEGRLEVNGQKMEQSPDAVLMITDGYAPEIHPEEPDKWVWLITEGGTTSWLENHPAEMDFHEVTTHDGVVSI